MFQPVMPNVVVSVVHLACVSQPATLITVCLLSFAVVVVLCCRLRVVFIVSRVESEGGWTALLDFRLSSAVVHHSSFN